ncbi:MAG: ABC transporter ATP-binding protein [Phycisphaerae bacterium]|nr:ABC transporter ATP-binding protein [Phycisphaerae bacterium]
MGVSLTVEAVNKSYGTTRVLEGISMSVAPGEIFFLLGPSGCGKTTLLRLLSGFAQPDRGRILMGDQDVTGWPPQRRPTALVFQNYAIWPHMTVAQNVAFGLRSQRMPRGEIRQRVQESLETVRLGDLGARRPSQLSGGQQQRVALARSLAVRPRILLLDEPLSNLDAKLRDDMRMEIRAICKEADVTAVYVTHDQKEALSIADRIAIMNAGRIAQVGAPRELYRRPASKMVAEFLGDVNLVPATVENAEGMWIKVRTPMGVLAVARNGGEPPAKQCILAVRPESIVPLNGQSAINVFRAVLDGRTYLGSASILMLRSGDTDLKVTRPESATPLTDADINGTTWTVDPNDLVLLPPS